MRLLPWPRPQVDLTIMEVLALPVERTVVGGHRLDDEVVRLPEPIHHADRVGVRGRELVWHALDEAHVEAPARDHVDGGELLGGAYRVGPMADRIAQDQNARALALARHDRQADDRGSVHAGRRLVMLIEHQIEPELVGEQIFVVIAMEQIGRDLRIERAIRQIDAQIAVRIIPGVGIGMLAEMIDSHFACPCVKAKMARANASGCSICG